MDTPERSKIGASPISKFEDSPIFNFINNLSPLQPLKSVHGAQVFPSLSLASISSVFSSPHSNQQKESKFLTRHPDLVSSKLETASDNFDESGLCSRITDSIDPDAVPENEICQLNEATVDPPDDSSSQSCNNVPQPIQYGNSSPDHNTIPCYGDKMSLKPGSSQTQVQAAIVGHDGVEKKKLLFSGETEVQEENQVDQSEEADDSSWENLICDADADAGNLLIFDSSTDSETGKNCNETFGDKDTNMLICSSSNSENVTGILEASQIRMAYDPCLKNAPQCPPQHKNEKVSATHTIDHTPQLLSGTFQDALSNLNHDPESGFDKGMSINCKVEFQQQRIISRRCLTYELARGSTKNSNLCTSISMQSSSKFIIDDNKSISLKPLIDIPGSMNPFPTMTVGNKSMNKSLDIANNQESDGPLDNASQAHEFGLDENVSQSSPKKRKRKSENSGESEGCKRCNCKKSKCLKLYCECFAAGIYCVEPCSCQGCFNKPIHEETVLNIRKQIESRNPLAFAPKVIRTSKSVHETREETNKTPASARHKRGCNCKKSGCLKKYCECYQGGVGCSPCCRCEGCRNTYGRKDADELEKDEEVIDNSDKLQEKPNEEQHNNMAQKDENSMLPLTPSFDICRPFVKQAFLSSGKPPLSTLSTLRKCDFPLQHKISNNFRRFMKDDAAEILRGDTSANNGVKTVSPNGKRVLPLCNANVMSPVRKGGRKLFLKSVPFPSLNNVVSDEH